MIPNQWYPVFQSERLRRRPVGVTRLGKTLVLWRDDSGRAIAMPDRCPHRSAVLSTGRVIDGCLQCPYHGLRFDSAGKCLMIPANGERAPVPAGFDLEPIAIREEHGLIWMWHGDSARRTTELPWLAEIPEPGGATASYSYETPVPEPRITENLLDFHHFHFLHRWVFLGVGPVMDALDAHVEGEAVVMTGKLRHERPRLLRGPTPFRAIFRLPAIAHIEIFGASINYLLSPVDENRTWIFGRYLQPDIPRALGGRIVSAMSARLDRAVFIFQDYPVLSRQVDAPGDLSKFHLYEADRGVALAFGMRKRAMLDANRALDERIAAAGQ
jgi:nitrite reductase/ring-hydroxylating ferredoxin subunit